jgi:ATP-binding cassette subfamily B protein
MTTVPYDLSPSGQLCRGELRWEGDTLSAVLEGGEETFRCALNDVEELVQRTDYGCGRLEVKYKDDVAHCVRFTMSCVNEIGEFCKAVNFYIKTGQVAELNREEIRRCPKCGRNLLPGLNTCLFCADKSYVWRRALQMTKEMRPALIGALVLVLCFDLTKIVLPLLSRWLLDDVLLSGGRAVEILGRSMTAGRAVLVFALATAALNVLGQVFLGNSTKLVRRGSYAVGDGLRRATYGKMQALSQQSLAKRTSGDLLKRITRDTRQLGNTTDYLRAILEKSILILVSAGVLFTVNPVLALLVLIPVPIVPVVARAFYRRMHQVYDKQWVCSSREASALHDIIRGIRVVKTFGAEDREIQKFSQISQRLRAVSIKAERFWALFNPPSRMLTYAGEILVTAVGGYMVIKGIGGMTTGKLFQFTLFAAYLYEPLRWMSALPRVLAGTTTSLLKVYELLDEPLTLKEAENPVREPIDGGIGFSGVQFGYKAYEPVLKDVNLEIRPNEMLGLVGHSGAGKSTMINLIMRLYDVDQGILQISGRDIREYDYAYLRENIAVVFQETFLFAGSVYDNIAYAKPGAPPAEVMRAARLANAHDFILRLPDGYNTVVGEDGHNLSGGERQRVAIARAVLKDPKILILDEATSALDPETEGKIQQALERLIKGRTTIAIAHRLSTLRHADRLAVIDKGRVAELGSHHELLEQKGIYYDLVMAQRQMAQTTK